MGPRNEHGRHSGRWTSLRLRTPGVTATRSTFAKTLAIVTASLALCLFGAEPGGAARASAGSVACLDSSSPSYAVDAKVVAALSRFGDPLTPFVFDGGEGVSERFFRYLSRTKCSIIMGFPVDLVQPDPPDGLALTKPYLDTAYVLVSHGLTQRTLKPGMTIAVGMSTAPHFYLAGALGSVPNYTTNTFQTQEQVLDAFGARKADAAMAWEPSVIKYLSGHGSAKAWTVSPLHIQHAQWHIAALYPEDNAAAAAKFDSALGRLRASGELTPITRPYTLETTLP